jgi:uncharacterized protein YaiI (UPF0178 family)
MLGLYIDIDTHAAYPQALRAAQQHALELYVVIKDYLPTEANVRLVLVQEDQENASSWIAANITRGDICVTADPRLATSCILRGATALSLNGQPWDAGTGAEQLKRLTRLWMVDPRAFAERLEHTIVTTRVAEQRGFASRPEFARVDAAS